MLQIEYKLKKASDFENEGKLLHALQIYYDIIAIERTCTQAYVRLSDLYERLRKPEKAIDLLKNYLEMVGEDTEIRLLLGQMQLKHSLWNEAAETLMMFPHEDQPVSLFFLGFANFMLGDYELAKFNMNAFIEKGPETNLLHEALLISIKCDLGLRLFDDALESLAKAEQKIKDSWEIMKLYGTVYVEKGMYLHAVSYLEKAIKLNPSESSLYELAGKAYLNLADYQNAEKNFLKAISGPEANSETYTYLGLACLNIKKIQDATNYFEMALNLDPSNEVALDGKKKCSS